MKLLGDFHTHTTYSHGTSTIAENAKQADVLGLEYLATTEHAYKSAYSIKHGDLEKMRGDIENIQDKHKVKLLLGIEANLISRDGDCDVPLEELKKLDLVVLGFHRFTKVKIKEFFKFVLPNLLRKKPSKKQIERNTEAYLKAIKKYPINILAHLQYGGCYVDCEKIAKECVKRGVYIELNGKRINFSKSDIEKMVATGVQFIIDSDAHDKLSIGKNNRAFNYIEKYKIPLNQIVNISGKPNFIR